MAGAIRLGELTHIMESRMETALEKSEFPAELFAELEEKMDRLSLDLERMQKGPEPVAPVAEPEVVAEPGLEATLSTTVAAPRAEAPLPSAGASLRATADT